MLTQPYNDIHYESADSSDDVEMVDSYIPGSHVRFLESGGARVVPLSYRYT